MWCVYSKKVKIGNKIHYVATCQCGHQSHVRMVKGRPRSNSCKNCAETGRKWEGNTGTPEYISWQAMKSRCDYDGNKDFHNYGGRGITYCERWKDFNNFIEDMGPRPKGKTLERIDCDKGYSKQNCKWATHKEQGNNKRNNTVIVIEGVCKTMSEWCKVFNCNTGTASYRYNKGIKGKEIFAEVRKSKGNNALSIGV